MDSSAFIFMVANPERRHIREVHNHNIHHRKNLSNILPLFYSFSTLRDFWTHTQGNITAAMMLHCVIPARG
jgi:hypothetical protein